MIHLLAFVGLYVLWVGGALVVVAFVMGCMESNRAKLDKHRRELRERYK